MTLRQWLAGLGMVLALGLTSVGCLDRPVAAPDPKLQSGVSLPVVNNSIDSVDILFEIDNSNSMRDNQAQLAAQFRILIDTLVNPPVNPMTGRPQYPPVKSMHVGVVSSDLGTPGSTVPSCANQDQGDDGLLNPIRNGQAIRSHQPWTTAPPGVRPARCTMDPNQYPSYLTFDAASTNAEMFREDFVCNAFLSIQGCGLEQQLESVYRAIVVHNAREMPGNTDPNAGFIRNNAVFAIVIVSDEEDGSVRDCRYAERDARGRPLPCQDALSVFDSTSPNWSSADLNLRFYMYRVGSPQDPTWPLDRYIDPANPNRGFLSVKPGHPDQVIFASIAGVPINLPMTSNGAVDYDMLLGPGGMGGFTGMSPEGPVSMQQANMDPMCTQRVVPACRREGSSYDPRACDTTAQYFAWPSRRLAQVAQRFGQNGTISSICRSNYSDALRQIVERIQQRLAGRCLPRALQTDPPEACSATRMSNCFMPGQAVRVNCVVRETLPAAIQAAQWCTAEHGRAPAGRDRATGREVCLVTQVPVPIGMQPPAGAHGYFYDTSPDPSAPECRQRISFTMGDSLPNGAEARIECVQTSSGTN